MSEVVEDRPAQPQPMGEVFSAFAKIGMLSFGGPAAQIAVMHRVLVEEKRWLSEERFLHALNFCMLLPGPEAMQLATYAGWLMRGVVGGLVAGLLFILPGLAMMLGLSAIYVVYGDVPLLEGLFYGLKAAVIAIVIQALLKVANKALTSRTMIGVAGVAFLAIYFFRIPFPLIIFGAAVFGFFLWRRDPATNVSTVTAELSARPNLRTSGTLQAAAILIAVWFGTLFLAFTVADEQFITQASLFFTQTAIVTFGGAYAVLAYVGQQVVEIYQWISAEDMLRGLGLAETTLGPLVLVLVFVGFVAGANALPGSELFSGLQGGIIAAFFTFVPCFVFIFGGAPFMERLREIEWLSASLKAITAAVVGVILNLAIWFAVAVFFDNPIYQQTGPIWLPQIDFGNVDYLALAIAAASAVALLRLKLNMPVVLGAAAAVGIATTFV
ncbi:MAG: chromate efflux transporter [Pseudomonadota bacterium]